MTIFQILKDASKKLEKVSDTPRLDAELLLAETLSLSRLDLILDSQKVPPKEQIEKFHELLTRRLKNEPVAYLLKTREFFGLEFDVSPDVLIPRPDTEVLVEKALEFLPSRTPATVIDVCTGSGCIAIALAKSRPMAEVYASDLSEKALQMAQQNVDKHELGERVSLRLGNLLEPFPLLREVDLIISNPPYIKPKDMAALMADVQSYEPHLALEGHGDHGVFLHQVLLQQAHEILKLNGRLIMEFGFDQKEDILSLDRAGFDEPEFLKDLGGNWRGVVFKKISI